MAGKMLIPRALPANSYKAWPSLSNPLAERPIGVARSRWASFRGRGSNMLRLKIWMYRAKRALRRLWRAVAAELTASPVKTIGEVVCGVAVAALPIDPYREWLKNQWFGWWPILIAALGGLVIGVFRRIGDRSETTARIRLAAEYLQLIIESSRTHTKEGPEGVEPTAEHLQQSLAVMLQAVADLVGVVLQVPSGVKLHANLMIPMAVILEDAPQPCHGLGIVAYSIKRPSSMAWTRLLMGDFGAGEAYETCQVQVIEDTRDPRWGGVFAGVRSRCFVSIPVLSGSSSKALAVVNVDADRELILTRKNVYADVYQVVVGAVALFGDVLHNTRVGAATSGASRRSTRRK